MRAVVYDEYGDESVLRLAELPPPKVGIHCVLVRVMAVSINPLDYKVREGKLDEVLDTVFPVVPGWDVAGVVESAHYTVRDFVPGDEVMGFVWKDFIHQGTFAELVSAPARTLVRKPNNVTWAQAAGLPLAGLTAYQALKTIDIHPGDVILVHGAAGGVGSLGAQIARIRGALVIGTASQRNTEYLRELGVEPVLYGDGLSDRVRALAPNGVNGVMDCFGNGSLSALRSLLARGVGADQMVTTPDRLLAADIGAQWIGVRTDSDDLAQLATWVDNGALTVPVGIELPLAEVAEAHRSIKSGHTRGKIVLTVE